MTNRCVCVSINVCIKIRSQSVPVPSFTRIRSMSQSLFPPSPLKATSSPIPASLVAVCHRRYGEFSFWLLRKLVRKSPCDAGENSTRVKATFDDVIVRTWTRRGPICTRTRSLANWWPCWLCSAWMTLDSGSRHYLSLLPLPSATLLSRRAKLDAHIETVFYHEKCAN